MANTPGGLPYPIGTDRVVDGDNAIRALAEAVESRTAAPRYKEFTLARGGVPNGATLYNLVPTESYSTPLSFAWTYDAGTVQFAITTPGLYLLTASIYIDWSNAGAGALIRLSSKTVNVDEFLAQSPFGGGQVASLAQMIRVAAGQSFAISGFHNAGGTFRLAGTMRIMKYGI